MACPRCKSPRWDVQRRGRPAVSLADVAGLHEASLGRKEPAPVPTPFSHPKCPDCGVTVTMYSMGVHGEPLCAAWGAVAVHELDAAAYARVYCRG